MQISDIFYHHKNHGYDELHHLKVFLQKTWRNPVISHDFRWKSQFSPKICIFKILINKKKNKGPFFFFFILLDLFYDCANFQVKSAH